MAAGPPFSRILAGLLAFVFFAILIRTAWISDDALITLRTVMNVTHGFGVTFNVAERVQTFTHPLWLLVLTAVSLVTGNVYVAAFVASIGVSLVAFWLALTRAASTWQAVVAGVVLLSSRAFVDYSTSGLENPLGALLVAIGIGVFVHEPRDPARRLTGLTLVASLLYLTRPDLVLIVAPLVAVAAARVPGVGAILRSLAIGAMPAIGWTLFSLVYYGFPFPNTAYAKLATHISRGELWSQGFLYVVDSLDRDPLTLTAIGFAILMGLTSGTRAGRALAGGIVLYLVYIVAIGGDFMAGRFFAVPVYAAAVLLGRLASGQTAVWGTVAVVFAIVGAASGHLPLLSNSRFSDLDIKPNGIVDERAVYFKNQSLVGASRQTFVNPDWPTRDQLPSRVNVMPTCGLMGGAGVGWGPATHLLDECALADPLLARLPAVFNTHWRTGHYRRMVPAGYEESLASGTNVLRDPGLHAYYDDIRLITRAPVWNRERWRAIARVNLGRTDALVNVPFYRHAGSLVRLEEVMDVKAEGTAWDAAGNTILRQPLAVTCEDQPGRQYLDVSLDSDDGYRLLFVKKDAVVGTLDLGPVPEHRRRPGLASFTADIPPGARRQGFDIVIVAPRGSNEHAAVGHLLLDGWGPTDAELRRRVAARESAK